jgi:signal transduction histidine kinase
VISPQGRNVPRRIPIRLKLAAALAVPICALLLVSALEVAQSASDSNRTEEQTDLATASIGPGGIITALQNERNYGSVYILGYDQSLQLPVASLDEATSETDDAVASFRAEIESKGGRVERTFEPALAAIDEEIDGLREAPRSLDPDDPDARKPTNTDLSDPYFTGFTELINTLFKANGQVALSIDDPTLRRGVELTDLATHEIENLALLTRVLLLAGVSDQLNEPGEIAEAAGLLGRVNDTYDDIADLGTGRYRDASVTALETFDASGYVGLVEQAIAEDTVPLGDLISSLSREEDEGFNGYRTAVNNEITARAEELKSDAAASQRLYLLLAALALIVAIIVTWLVSRSITKPLWSLTRQAKEMADRRLPEAVTDILETPLGEDVTVPTVQPVRVNTRDEVSDVADALNTVQDSALDLAVEQAVLRRNIADSFVNLGRRNQNLLGRQLDFITELESNETDADALANLFRLDHLATRMRRNAESLLVLAGIDPPRQWAAPVRLTDVIRAALGEVEDYQRVTVRGVEPATILGSAAADLAHLLAELIENALVFSPPDQAVDIRGRIRPDGYTLAIIDSGLGMPPADVAAANRRLAGAESFTIAPSKYLGHYVAGNLAARHDIRVHLDNSPGNGITATIDIPPTLLTTDHDLAAPVTPPHGTRALATGKKRRVAADPLAALSGPRPAGPELAPPGPATTGGLPAVPAVTGPVPATPALAPPPAGSPWAAVGDAPGFDPSRRADQPAGQPPATVPPPAPAAPGDPRSPVPPAPILGGPAPAAGPRGDVPASRTASGLVKRAPRGAAQAPLGAVPDDALLASLSNVTSGLSQRPTLPPSAPPPSEPIGPTWPRGSSARPLGPGGDQVGGGARSWPAPPALRSDTPGVGNTPPRPEQGRSGLPPLAARNGGGAGTPPVPSPDPATGGATASGLARRVRGAQLPVSQPLSVRRRQEPPSAGDAGYRLDDRENAKGQLLGSANTNGHPNGQSNGHVSVPFGARDGNGDHDESSAARSVYGFLTSFTQGVQRGLEEARRDPNTPKENS